MAATAAVAAVVVAAAGTGYTVYSGEEQADAANKEAEKQDSRYASEQASAKERQQYERDQDAAVLQRDQVRRRQMAMQFGGSGRYGTMLTQNGQAPLGGGSSTLG